MITRGGFLTALSSIIPLSLFGFLNTKPEDSIKPIYHPSYYPFDEQLTGKIIHSEYDQRGNLKCTILLNNGQIIDEFYKFPLM